MNLIQLKRLPGRRQDNADIEALEKVKKIKEEQRKDG
jgi:hypothetical protein